MEREIGDVVEMPDYLLSHRVVGTGLMNSTMDSPPVKPLQTPSSPADYRIANSSYFRKSTTSPYFLDGGIPVSCLLTSASVHDSQAAIPLATLTARRVTSLYDLMDSAYDAPEIRAFSPEAGPCADH